MTSGQMKISGPNRPSGGGAIDWYNIVVLLLSTVSISGVIALYVVSLAWFNLKNNATDPLERAARAAAEDLLRINVVSASFGNVGIADFNNTTLGAGGASAGAVGEVRSYNTAASLVRTSLNVAKRYKLPALAEQAGADLQELQALKEELRRKIVGSIQAGQPEGGGKIFEHVRRILSNHPRGGQHLQALTIRLGYSIDRMQVCTIEAEADDPPAIVGRGRLRTMTPIAVPLSPEILYFEQQPKDTAIIDNSQFMPSSNPSDPDSAIPTTLSIEAQFSSGPKRSDIHATTLIKKEVCVIAGADYKNQPFVSPPSEGCFAIGFLQGRPQQFKSLADILQYKGWRAHAEWQQAIQGGVPGSGNLAPPALPALKTMDGGESLSIALYHWLRGLSRPISPKQLEAMLTAPWHVPPPPNLPSTNNTAASALPLVSDATGEIGAANESNVQANSGLLKDSGARLFALLYQNKQGELGQKALFNCFQGIPNKFPPSTLPLVIDNQGQANLPGHQGFDRSLAIDLLSGIYGTNLAAQDCLATARLIQASAMRAYRSSKERLFLAQTDLESLTNRLKLESDANKKKLLTNEIDWRNNRITYELNEQKKQLRAYSLSQTAVGNAQAIAVQSYECGAKLFQLARAGINRLENFPGQNGRPLTAFLLGKRFVFCPCNQSLQESDILEEASRAFDSSNHTDQVATQTPLWLIKNARVFGPVKSMTTMADTRLIVEGRSLSDLQAEAPTVLKADPLVIVLTPDLLAAAKVTVTTPLYFREYPFKGLGVPERQLFYYCQNGYQSQSVPSGRVMWSVLVRDAGCQQRTKQ